jgi:uncharacterized membrane protein YfcA
MLNPLGLDLMLGFAIGLSLGLMGGGGSILTVPALVYLVGQTPQAAMTTSLAIVGVNSALGAAFHHRQGTLDGRVALIFGSSGMILAYLSAGLAHLFSPAALMVAFAGLMLLVGGLMLRGPQSLADRSATPPSWGVALASGAGVGLLTGLLGVGGGFLIVPALVMLVGLPMRAAVGTSLVVIAANSLAGFAGHLQTPGFDLRVTLIFILAGLGGTYLGSRLANHLPAARLRQVFATLVTALAFFLLYDNLPKLF